MDEPAHIKLAKRAKQLGFDVIGITSAKRDNVAADNLQAFVDAKWHGEMSWIATTLERRKSPDAMWAKAKSAIVLATNYSPQSDPMARLNERSNGVISVYALNRDYHDVIKGRLKQLAGWFASQTGKDVKVFVDTAPLMEKPLAQRAGIGWQGKHTNLVSREYGSWLFLGVILTTADLVQSDVKTGECGSCRSCIDICPTNAIPSPYKVDARRCISYLTIEFDGVIDNEFRRPIGNRIYGCDDCLAVCPWNKFAKPLAEEKFKARHDLISPSLGNLAKLDDAAFRKFFSGSPVKRIGRNRFVRNVAIAIGNSTNPDLKKTSLDLIGDDSTQVRAMAVWAAKQLFQPDEFNSIREKFLPIERDKIVQKEWKAR